MAQTNRVKTARSRSDHRYSVKKRRRRATILLITGIVVVLLIAVGICAFFHFRSYDNYQVKNSLDITNSDERTTFAVGENGYIKCAGDGITFFDKKGIIWAETFEMTQPLMDVCGSYIAVADLKGSDIYIYDGSGLVNRFSISHPILDIEVSMQGVVAAAANDGTSNYIEVLDKEGKELIMGKSVFSSSGYLMDIALAENGETLAAAYIYVSEGSLESKVVFYDFSGANELMGGFNQYRDTIVTNVEYLNENTVCAVGDSAISIYKVAKTPSLIYEDLELSWEIDSVIFGEGKVGLIVEDENSDHGYSVKVYNTSGKQIVDQGFDFSYNKASFAGKNLVLTSSNDCEIYSFTGVRKFAYSFDERIEAFLSCGNGRDFVYASPNSTDFIRIK